MIFILTDRLSRNTYLKNYIFHQICQNKKCRKEFALMSLTFLQKGDQKCDQNTDEKEELGIKYTKEKHYMLLLLYGRLLLLGSLNISLYCPNYFVL